MSIILKFWEPVYRSDGSHKRINERNILNKLRAASYYYVDLADENIISKCKVWNTFILPKVTHILNVTPYSKSVSLSVRRICVDFLKRDNGRVSVAYDRLSTHPSRGGVGLVNIDRFWKALNVKWFKKIQKSGAIWATKIKLKVGERSNMHFNRSINLGLEMQLQSMGTFGLFWSVVSRLVRPLLELVGRGMGPNEPIKDNSRFKSLKGGSIYGKVSRVRDLFDNNMELSPMDEVEKIMAIEIFDLRIPEGNEGEGISLYENFTKKSKSWIKKNLGVDGFERNKFLLRKYARESGSNIPPVAAIHILNDPKLSNSVRWFKLQSTTGCLVTNEKRGSTQESKKCNYCREIETSKHFLVECSATKLYRDLIKTNVESAWNIRLADHHFVFLYAGRKASEINKIIGKFQCTVYAKKAAGQDLDDDFGGLLKAIIISTLPRNFQFINILQTNSEFIRR